MNNELNVNDHTVIVMGLTYYIDTMIQHYKEQADPYYYNQAKQANETAKKITGNDHPYWVNYHNEKENVETA